MKKQFQSKTYPQGSRTLWRYLSAFILFFALSIGQMWGAWQTTTVDGTIGTRDSISADGLTREWNFTPATQQVKPSTTAFSEYNDMLFKAGSSDKLKSVAGSGWSCNSSSNIYIPVPAGSAGTITLSVYSASDSRYLQLYKTKDNTIGTSAQRLYSKENASGITSDGKKGPRSFSFTAADTTMINGVAYLHFKDNNTEMKINGFSIVLTTGSYPVASGPVDPTASFSNGDYTIGGADLDLSSLFESNSDGAVTFTITNQGTTDAALRADGKSFYATTAGMATVKVEQASTSSYNAYDATASITVAACETSISGQPSNASLKVGDANPTLSVTASNAASYAWKESSDGTSYDGASTLGTDATYTPSVNDAVQTKYYYCEVTSSCSGSAVVKSNIVTVEVEAADPPCAELVPAASGDAPAAGGAISLATATGGSMKALTTNISYTAYGLLFGSSSSTKAEVTLNHLMQVGTVITATIYNDNNDKARGLNLLNSSGTSKATWTKTQTGDHVETYTVVAGDGLAGSNVFQLQRNNNAYLKSISVSNCGAELFALSSAVSVDGKATVTLSKNLVAAGATATATYSDIDAAYDFDEWEITSGDATIEDASVNPAVITMGSGAATITLKSKAASVKYAVHFDSKGGSAVADQSIEAGEHASVPTAPTKFKYTFGGWCETDGGSTPADLSAIAITAEKTFYAIWTPKVCPTSGEIYSFVSDGTKAPGSNTYCPASGVKGVVDIATYATVSGGLAQAVHTTTSNNPAQIQTSTSAVKLSHADGYFRALLECPLQEGDTIKFVKTNKVKMAFDSLRTKVVEIASGTGANKDYYIVPSTYAGEDTIMVYYGGSSVNLTALRVVRPEKLAVTFDEDGGSEVADAQVVDGGKVTEPSPDPTKENYRFDYWYKVTGEEGQEDVEYDFDATVSAAMTLKAHWTRIYTVTYVAGDAGATGDAPTQEALAEGEKFDVAANTFSLAGNDFVNWKDQDDNEYDPTDEYTMPAKNVTLTAQWTVQAEKYTVIFKDGTTELATKQFEVGNNPSDADVDKTKPLNTFAAWQKDAADIALDAAFWATVEKDAEITLTARWTKIYAQTADLAAEAAGDKTAIATFLSGKGYAATVGNDGAYDTNASGYNGYKFKNNGDEIQFYLQNGKMADLAFMYIETDFKVYVDEVLTYTVTNKTTSSTPLVKNLYADGADQLVRIVNGSANSKTSVINKITIRAPYQVSFDANGGDPVAAQYAIPSVTLPSATNGTQNFAGWYTSGDELVGMNGDSYTPTADITLVAHWEALSTINTLSDLKVNGETVDGFDADVHTYNIVVPYGTDVNNLPKITSATATNANATVSIFPQDGPVWTDDFGGCYRQQANVTPQDPNAAIGYNDIRITIGPKDQLMLMKATHDGTAQGATIEGYYGGSKDKNTQNGGKLGGNDQYFGIKLAEEAGTFQAGDVLKIHATSASALVQIFSDKGETAIDADGHFDTNGDYTFTLTDATEWIYLYRTSTAGSSMNPTLGYMAVYRPYPVPVVNTITFNGAEGVVGESTITANIPYTTDMDNLQIEATFMSNDPANTNGVISGDWTEESEGVYTASYVVTDKDEDTKTYAVTLTRAAVSHDATLTALEVEGYSIDFDPYIYAYSVELPYGSTVGDLPAVTYTPAAGATAVKTAATTLPGNTVIAVTAEDGETSNVYTISISANRTPSLAVFDGRTMSAAVAEFTDATTGLSWTSEGASTSSSSNTKTINGRTYTKSVKIFGGTTAANRYLKFTVPANYMAKFYIAGSTNSSTGEATLFIAKELTADPTKAISGLTASVNDPKWAQSGLQLPGDYYFCVTGSARIYELSVQLYPIDKTRELTPGMLSTTCLPNGGLIAGAAVFEIDYMDYVGSEPNKIYFREVVGGVMQAGMPYVVLAEEGSTQFAVTYTDNANASAQSKNGLVGYLGDQRALEENDYFIYNNKFYYVSAVDAASGRIQIVPERAYIHLEDVPGYNNEVVIPSPSRGRRVFLSPQGQQVATGFEDVVMSNDMKAEKVLLNGQFFILRGEKMYDATGRLVK